MRITRKERTAATIGIIFGAIIAIAIIGVVVHNISVVPIVAGVVISIAILWFAKK